MAAFTQLPLTLPQTAADMTNGSADIENRPRSDSRVIIPFVTTAVLLLAVDLSIALTWQRDVHGLARPDRSQLGRLAPSTGSGACDLRADEIAASPRQIVWPAL
ncbi:hypothetical protein [Bradyrhizobium sp. BTAi1]|jgi:hypothetical protein|uniref:hypothetical protein n=1 Tax=Bradyrhizobium sp. (strain BTAi1 / ATCC BAA-1182) TaxID=288000 RepID=UPI00005DE6CA|nr:hypothetical protein [Bradyrhizobium sp. BTAi1]ABQ34681.1 hypothetical protein BBta_2523 [Bradyrhizobium sp. BTAi1]